MLMYISALIVGILLLVWSADRFIDGSAKLAKRLRFPTLIVGMVVVGFGTSAPEMVVSATAAWQGDAALALGNAIGSNIINITLILGVTALLTPLALNQRVLKKEIPFLIIISLLSGFIFWDLKVTRLEGGILLVVLMVFLFWMLKVATGGKNEATEEKIDLKIAIFWIFFGLILLIFSSKILLWGAKNLALEMGISELIIGLSIIALGTSLPELAASVVAVFKKEHDIAIGNIVGSNIFNLLAVVGLASVISPMEGVAKEFFYRDWIFMNFVTLLLLLLGVGFLGKKYRISFIGGAVLLVCYLGYNAFLYKEMFL